MLGTFTNTGDFPEDVSKSDCMGKPTVARWLGAVGKFVSRRGEAGFWRRALCPRILHPKRGKAKDLVMCCTKRERLGGLVRLPGID
eukprot:1189627-Prorocentrum_minimum.AAC.1